MTLAYEGSTYERPEDGDEYVVSLEELLRRGEAAFNNAPGGSAEFLGGNREFLTKKLWGAANEWPYFHHGQFTTLRAATIAHAGEALASRQQFENLSNAEHDQIIEFLKTLRIVASRR